MSGQLPGMEAFGTPADAKKRQLEGGQSGETGDCAGAGAGGPVAQLAR